MRCACVTLLAVALLLAVGSPVVSGQETMLSFLETGFDSCATCLAAMEYIFEAVDSGKISDNVMLSTLVGVCDGKHLYPHEVCHGVIKNLYGPVFLKNVRNMPHEKRNAKEVCAFFRACDDEENGPRVENMDSRTPPQPFDPEPLLTDEQVAQLAVERQARAEDGKILRILHITDIHPDIYYKQGTNTQCGKPMCCRERDGPGHAGQFGDYNCDAPMNTVEHAFQWAAQELKPDIIVWSGDTTSHTVWESTYAENQKAIEMVSKALHDAMPDVPAFPTIGNHESVPCDNFVVPPSDAKFFYEYIANAWKPWLGDQHQSFIDNAGFWTKLVRPGLRFVGFNSQFGDMYNFYLLPNSHADVGGQLVLLEKTLAAARKAGEKVILSAHIFPGASQCSHWFCLQLDKLIAEYSDVISSFLAGHTHDDKMVLIHDAKGQPVISGFMPGSLTMIGDLNMNMRIWEYDLEHNQIVEGHQYFMDVEKANKEGKMTWTKAYTFTEVYKVPDLSPASVRKVAETVRTNEAYAITFWFNRHCQRKPITHASAAVRAHLYCEVVTDLYENYDRCMRSLGDFV